MPCALIILFPLIAVELHWYIMDSLLMELESGIKPENSSSGASSYVPALFSVPILIFVEMGHTRFV